MPLPTIPRLGREPALDGIRGFAVLIVLGHNLGWPWLPGGFFGVDVFFALSGFLITTLLLEEQVATGEISLGRFFVRRGLRLYPALVVLVAFSVASVFVLHPPTTTARVTLVALSVLGYFSNWVLALDPGAWAGGMAHTWSLAIEVHFYVLWALLVVAITRRRGIDLRALGSLALIFALGSGLWRAGVWWQGWDTHLLYASTATRLDSVFLGAGAALVRLHHYGHRPSSPWGRVNRWLVRGTEAVCLGGIASLVCTVGQNSPAAYLGGFSLAGAATALLILSSLLTEHSIVARIASHRILAWFGVISYSIYLWHVPMGKLLSVERIAPLGLPPPSGEVLRAALMIVIGAGSYYGIERFFLRLKNRVGSRQPGRTETPPQAMETI
jgi:peptidoglycan/LPS O-acetylase OafA/YrhL